MNLPMLLYTILLFFLLAPRQLLTLPSSSSSHLVVNLTHAVIFAVIFQLTHKRIYHLTNPAHKNMDSSASSNN